MALDAKTSAPPAILEPVIASSNRAADVEPYSASIYNEDPAKWSAILPSQFPQAADRQTEEAFLRKWFDEREIHMQGGSHGPGNAFRFLKQVWYTIAMWNLYERIPRIGRWWLSKKTNREVFDDKNMLSHICKPDSQPEAFFDPADFEMFGRPILVNTVKYIQDLAIDKHAEIKPEIKPARPQLERLQIPKRPYIDQSVVKTGSPVDVKAAKHQSQIAVGENVFPRPVMMLPAGSPLVSPYTIVSQQPTPLLAPAQPVSLLTSVITSSQSAHILPCSHNISRPEHAKQASRHPMVNYEQGHGHHHNDGTWTPAEPGRIGGVDPRSASSVHRPWTNVQGAESIHADGYVQHQQDTRQPASGRQQTSGFAERGNSRGRGSLRGRGRGRDKGNRRYSTSYDINQPDFNSGNYSANKGLYNNPDAEQHHPHMAHTYQQSHGPPPAFNNVPHPHAFQQVPVVPHDQALQQMPAPGFVQAGHQGMLTYDRTNSYPPPPQDRPVNTYGVGRTFIHASRKDVTELIVFSSPSGVPAETIVRLFAQKNVHSVKTGASATKNGTGNFLFVTCKNNMDARRALELSGTVLDGTKITIEVSRKYWDPTRDGHYGSKQVHLMPRIASRQPQPYHSDRPDGSWAPMPMPQPMYPHFQAEMPPPPQPLLHERAIQQDMNQEASPVPTEEPEVVSRVKNKKKKDRRDKSESHGPGYQADTIGNAQRRASVQQKEVPEVKIDDKQRSRNWSVKEERRMSAADPRQECTSTQQPQEDNHPRELIDASPKIKENSRTSSEITNPYEVRQPASTEVTATDAKPASGSSIKQAPTDASSVSSTALTHKSSVTSVTTLAKSVVDSVQSTRIDAPGTQIQAVDKQESEDANGKAGKNPPSLNTKEPVKEEKVTDDGTGTINESKSSTEPTSAVTEGSANVNEEKHDGRPSTMLHAEDQASIKGKEDGPANDTSSKPKKAMSRSVSIQEKDKTVERPKGPSQTESFSMFGRKAEKSKKKDVKTKGSIKGKPKEKTDRIVSAPVHAQAPHDVEQAESQPKKSGKQRAHTMTATSPSSSKNKPDASDAKHRSGNMISSLMKYLDPNADDCQSPSDDTARSTMSAEACLHNSSTAVADSGTVPATPSDLKDASMLEDTSFDDNRSVSSHTLSNRSEPDDSTPSSSIGKRASKRALVGTHLVEAKFCRNSRKRQVRRRAEQQVITTLEVEEATDSGASVYAYSEDSHGNKVEQVWPLGYLQQILNQNQRALGNSIGPEARDQSYIHLPMPIIRLEGAYKDSIVELSNHQASEDAPITSILTLRVPESSPERAVEEDRIEEIATE